jgi:uncharacterized protein (TIGR03435 family)
MIRPAIVVLACCVVGAFGQVAPTFEVASVKANKIAVGHDGIITTNPGRFTARDATLKRLIFEAWQIPYSQITGGPAWIDSDEFDIEAKAEGAAGLEQIRLMLRALLIERFKLAVHVEKKEGRVYALVLAKDGPKLRRVNEVKNTHGWQFQGTLSEFAARLAIQLTIPLVDDPAAPSRARGAPVPVLNKTGIEGVFDIGVDLKPDQAGDSFTFWRRVLQEQLGLRLESQTGSVDLLVVDQAETIRQEN